MSSVNETQTQYIHTLALYNAVNFFGEVVKVRMFRPLEENQFQVFKKNAKFHLTSTPQKPNWYVDFGHGITTGLKKNLCKLLC